MPRAYNILQAAKMLSVARPVVLGWIDNGQLRAYRIPFTTRRKILHDDLEAFCREHGISFAFEPLRALPRNVTRKAAVLVGLDPSMVKQLRPLLEDQHVDAIVI